MNSPLPYRLVFEAEEGAYNNGDKAVDDITAALGGCLPIGDCDFEVGICGWSQVC